MITVRMASGAACEILTCDHWTCRELSLEVERQLGVPASQQRLIHGGRLVQEVVGTGPIGELLTLGEGEERLPELLLLVRSAEVAEALGAVRRSGVAL